MGVQDGIGKLGKLVQVSDFLALRASSFSPFSYRYFLYYWPVTAAVIGISINFFLLSLITVLSWLQLFSKPATTKTETLKISKRRGKTPVKKPRGMENILAYGVSL